MPNRQTHAYISILVVGAAYFILSVQTQPLSTRIQFLIAGVLLIIGGVFPDLLDPASLPSFAHRKFFHSKGLLLTLTIATCLAAVIWIFLFRSTYVLYPGAFFLGYIIHLLADWPSKMGLPKR